MTDHSDAHHSGYQNEPASERVRARVVVIACACIAFVATGCKDKVTAPSAKPTHARAPKNPANTVEKPKVVEQPNGLMRVTAEELDAEFDENRGAAETKYKDKVIEVSGKVRKIDRSDPAEITVELAAEGEDTVDCDFLRKDAQQLTGLKKGQEVVIRGKCVGLVEGTVTLEECSIVK